MRNSGKIGKIRTEKGQKKGINNSDAKEVMPLERMILSVFALLDFHIVYLNKFKNELISSFISLFYVKHSKQKQPYHQNTRT